MCVGGGGAVGPSSLVLPYDSPVHIYTCVAHYLDKPMTGQTIIKKNSYSFYEDLRVHSSTISIIKRKIVKICGEFYAMFMP